MKELKTVFGSFCNDSELKQIMAEADTDGDDKITFEEFKVMMTRFKSVNSLLHSQWTFHA